MAKCDYKCLSVILIGHYQYMLAKAGEFGLGLYNQLQQMQDVQSGELVRVEPENVIVFYRNEFQSASSIKITKNAALKDSVKFQLKTTNKTAYLVSQSSGEIGPNQMSRYINILINQQVPLEQCLHDRFKLVINISGLPPIEKKFKVIIDYKKDLGKISSKQLHRLEVGSKTSGSIGTNPSIIGQPITTIKKSMLKKSQLMNCLGNTSETQRLNIKEELDELVRKVDERRSRLDYLQKQIQKNKSRQRFMLYLAIIVVILALVLGITVRKSVLASINLFNILDH